MNPSALKPQIPIAVLALAIVACSGTSTLDETAVTPGAAIGVVAGTVVGGAIGTKVAPDRPTR